MNNLRTVVVRIAAAPLPRRPHVAPALAAGLALMLGSPAALAQMSPDPAEAEPATTAPAADAPAASSSPERAAAPGKANEDSNNDRDADEAVLRGPDVPENLLRTLVAFDAQGRLAQVDGRPEVAALGLLDLDPMQREAARAAIAERNAALATFMLDSLDQARESADAIEAGNRERANEIGRELYDRFDPEHARDPVLTPLQNALPTEYIAEITRMVDEYWTVRLERETRNVRDSDKNEQARAAAQQRILLGLFQQELRSAYDRTLRPYREKIETINRIAQPTDAQRQAIRTIIIDFVRQTRLQPTPEQQQEMARQIYRALDEEQRMKLFEAALTRL